MPPSKRPLLIGITGNIGSGKSSFCQAIEAQGICVIYTDTIANQRLADSFIIEALLNRYSTAILKDQKASGSSRQIDRQKLAETVFKNPKEVEYLNSLLHPLVLEDMQEIVETSDDPVLCFEVPLLFEANLQKCFDYLILVTATKETRLNRLVARGEALSNARHRMYNQLDDSFKKEQVDLVIENDDSIERLYLVVNAFVAGIGNIPQRYVSPFSPLLAPALPTSPQ